jgi:hypothetical protein
MRCLSAAGVGSGYRWTVTVASLPSELSVASANSSYEPPVVWSVKDGDAMATGGLSSITVFGQQFGPSAGFDAPVVRFGNTGLLAFAALNCHVVGDDGAAISCVAPAGVGKSLSLYVVVGGQSSGSDSQVLVSYAPPSILSVMLQPTSKTSLDTSGSTMVLVSGSEFGPGTHSSLFKLFAADTRDGGLPLFPPLPLETTCVVSTTSIATCSGLVGIGRALLFTVVVAGQASPSFSTSLNFSTPTISSIVVEGPAVGVAAVDGSSTVLVRGAFLGPGDDYNVQRLGFSMRNAVGRVVSGGVCTVVTPHEALRCGISRGLGVGYAAVITVGGQPSSPFMSTLISYAAPVVTSVRAPTDCRTSGGAIVRLTGLNFGATLVSPVDLVATYGPVGALTRFRARGCVWVSPGAVDCEMSEGVGGLLKWTLAVGNNSNVSPTGDVAYNSPAVQAVGAQGDGSVVFGTLGGTAVVVSGRDFGVAGWSVGVTYGPNAAPQRYTAGQCNVTTAHTRVTCWTSSGSGIDHSWTISIQGLSSQPSEALTAYRAPSITSIAPAPGAPTILSALLTVGGDSVLVMGTDFGPSAGLQQVSVGAVSARPVVTSGATSLQYVLRCDVVEAHKSLRCITTPGIKAGLRLVVIVDGQSSATTDSVLAYKGPEISRVRQPDRGIHTDGTSTITLTGRYFGPSTPDNGPVLYYGPASQPSLFTAGTPCTVMSDTQVTCPTVVGVGADNMTTAVAVGGQRSGGSSDVIVYAPPAVTGVDISSGALFTEGGSVVTVTGINFGPSGALATLQYWAMAAPLVLYSATGCVHTVGQEHTMVVCGSTPGVGTNVRWRISVGQQTSTVFSKGAFNPPVLTGVGPTGADMPTAGDVAVTLVGTSFGPPGSGNPVRGFLRLDGAGVATTQRAACEVVNQRNMICRIPPGLGGGVVWGVEVGLQNSSMPAPGSLQPQELQSWYKAPSVTSIALVDPAGGLPGLQRLPTAGGTEVLLIGTNMGPSWPQWTLPTAQLTAPAPLGLSLPATACTVVDEHKQVRCRIPVGVGRDFRWTVTVGNVPSAPSVATTAYMRPAIVSVNATALDTRGGEAVVVTGTNFGPGALGPAPTLSYGPYQMATCVVVDDSKAQCSSVPGVGAGLGAVLTIGLQANDQGALPPAVAAYGPPNITLATPRLGPVRGFIITLTGFNFGAPALGPLNAWAGPTPCAVGTHTHTAVGCLLGAGPAGTAPIRVSVGGLTSAVQSSLSIAVYRVLGLSVVVGPAIGGTRVTIFGENLVAGATAQVRFGDVAGVDALVVSAQQLSVIAPPSAVPSGLAYWSVPVNVTLNGRDWDSATDAFTYYPVTVVESVWPRLGPRTGGTVVTITGRIFNTSVVNATLTSVPDSAAGYSAMEAGGVVSLPAARRVSLACNLTAPKLASCVLPRLEVPGRYLVQVGVETDADPRRVFSLQLIEFFAHAETLDSGRSFPPVTVGTAGTRTARTPASFSLYLGQSLVSAVPLGMLDVRVAPSVAPNLLLPNASTPCNATLVVDLQRQGRASDATNATVPRSVGASLFWQSTLGAGNAGVGASVDHVDVVEVDTVDVVQLSRIARDCSDLSVVDATSLEPLYSWVEPHTCNTSATRVWVRVPDGGSVCLVFGASARTRALDPFSQPQLVFGSGSASGLQLNSLQFADVLPHIRQGVSGVQFLGTFGPLRYRSFPRLMTSTVAWVQAVHCSWQAVADGASLVAYGSPHVDALFVDADSQGSMGLPAAVFAKVSPTTGNISLYCPAQSTWLGFMSSLSLLGV